jgi:hypothetical protein
MRKPNDKKLALMEHWKFKRRSRKIPLRMVADFGGFSLQYLKNIEAGYDTISDSVIRVYKKTIEIIDRNTKKDVEYEKLCDK